MQLYYKGKLPGFLTVQSGSTYTLHIIGLNWQIGRSDINNINFKNQFLIDTLTD